MTSYLENFSNMKSLLDSISGHRNKLATAGNPIDIKRITKKIETEEDLLLNAVVSLSPSPGIDEILAEIMYGDLFGFIEDIRDYRSQLERFLGQGNRVDADRITRELAPLESALSRICGLEVERGKIESVLGPPDCVKVAHSSETVDGKKSLALRQVTRRFIH